MKRSKKKLKLKCLFSRSLATRDVERLCRDYHCTPRELAYTFGISIEYLGVLVARATA